MIVSDKMFDELIGQSTNILKLAYWYCPDNKWQSKSC